MKIRFKVNQVTSFLRGLNVEPTKSLEIDPSNLSENQRELIGEHLLETDVGVDVVYDPKRARDEYIAVPIGEHSAGDLVEAKGPSLGDLLEALEELSQRN